MKNFFPSKTTSDPYAYAIGGAKKDPYAYSVGPQKTDPYAVGKGIGGTAKGPTKSAQNTKYVPPSNIEPEKLALAYDVPTILVEYRDPDTDKLYHHKIVIKKLTKDTKNSDALDYLKKKHGAYIKNIEPSQLQKLIDKLKSKLPAGKTQPSKETSKPVMQRHPVPQDDFDYDVEDEDY